MEFAVYLMDIIYIWWFNTGILFPFEERQKDNSIFTTHTRLAEKGRKRRKLLLQHRAKRTKQRKKMFKKEREIDREREKVSCLLWPLWVCVFQCVFVNVNLQQQNKTRKNWARAEDYLGKYKFTTHYHCFNIIVIVYDSILVVYSIYTLLCMSYCRKVHLCNAHSKHTFNENIMKRIWQSEERDKLTNINTFRMLKCEMHNILCAPQPPATPRLAITMSAAILFAHSFICIGAFNNHLNICIC